jgi:predicted Na+-dependent transporter
MPIEGPVPEWLFTAFAAATVFAVMFNLGLGIEPGESRWVKDNPAVFFKSLFSVLIGVPIIALVVTRIFDLPREVEIGIVLMAISPGAPVALRRSLEAGGHRAFAPTLQVALAALAVVSMPLSIAALDEVYAGNATAEPRHLAAQVLVAQLLPLGLGILQRRASPARADWLLARLGRVIGVLLAILLVLAVIAIAAVVARLGFRVNAAIVVVTLLALALGHTLGGPEPSTRTALAIASAARNPGLALLVATLNSASPAIKATVLTYLVTSALTVIPYVIWRRRRGARSDLG